ncbi:uncharacterized protein LOC143904629 isoform X3 [Temnothorax americanus]|uniref:uncharacterized protein LOC143904629 isoform X3 n=1 Tax=Temnothorax americanus TaxID=1964332 RepID=UPI0040691DAF
MDKARQDEGCVEKDQNLLVEYGSDDSTETVIERKKIEEKDIEKEKKLETRGATSKPKEKPQITEEIRLPRFVGEDRPILPIGSKILYEQQEKFIARNEAMTGKLETTFKTLERVMTQANSMIENMVRVSEANLESKRLNLDG